MKLGRKVTYDATKLPDILKSVEKAKGSLGQVADLNGISRNTFYDWIRQGDSDKDAGLSTELAQLSCSIRLKQAEVVCEIAQDAFSDDKAARFITWWLARICREDFGDEGIEIRELREIFKIILPLMNKGQINDEVNSSKTQENPES